MEGFLRTRQVHIEKVIIPLQFSQPRTQALSSTLLAGENTLAGAGHVTHTKLIAYQGDGKVSGLILHVSTSALHTSIARSGRLKNHLSESYILQNTC